MSVLGIELQSVLIILTIGFVAGLSANVITRRHSKSAFGDVLLGIFGAGVGTLLIRLFGVMPRGDFLGAVLVATFGAIVLIWFNRRFMRE